MKKTSKNQNKQKYTTKAKVDLTEKNEARIIEKDKGLMKE